MGQISVKVDDELLERIDALDGKDRTEKVLGVLERGLVAPPEGLDTVLLSTSQIASLDQTAARLGLSRAQAIHRFLKERIEREFVQERQRQAFGQKTG